MDEYLSAYELLKRWGIKTIQLFNRCKKLDLQPYNWREEKIVTLDSCIETKEYKEFIPKRTQELKRIAAGTELTRKVLTEPGMHTPTKRRTDEDFEREAIIDFRPKDCELFDYGLPRTDSAAKQKLKKFLNFLFKESDIKRYEIEHGLYEPDILPKECEIVRDFAKHLYNVAKKLEEDEITGSKRYVYVKLGTDHFRHAFNYEAMARQYGSRSLFSDCLY